MKKAITILLIVGGVLLAAGITLFLVGLSLNGWKLSYQFTDQTYVSESSPESVDLELDAGMMVVQYADVEKVTVVYPHSELAGYTVREEGGKIIINYKRSALITGSYSAPHVKVSIPKDVTCSIKLKMDAGTLTLESGTYENVVADMDAGTLTLKNIVCRSAKLSVDAGTLTVDELKCDDVSVNLDAGSCNIKKLDCPEIAVEMHAGSVALDIVNLKLADYNVSVDKRLGTCNLPESLTAATSNHINVKLYMGSCTVNFSN